MIRSKLRRALVAKDRRAAIPVKHFIDLYASEQDCKAGCLHADTRAEERRRRSFPCSTRLTNGSTAFPPSSCPHSHLGQATTSGLPALRLRHQPAALLPQLLPRHPFEIENGRTERRIRSYAVARRDFRFTDSARRASGGRPFSPSSIAASC